MQNIFRTTALTAVAAAAVMAAAPSFATDVTIYGRMDLGLRYESNHNQPKTQIDSATNSGIGFKGQEDLGHGLKAFFQMEHRLDAGTGAAKDDQHFFNDISVIGLSGNFGTVRMGRSDNPLDLAADPDAFGGDYVGGRGNRRAGADEKWDNGLMYFTPVIHGFQGVVGTSFQEEPSGTADRLKNPVAATVLYSNGPLTAGLGYMQRANQDKAVGGSVTYDFGPAKAFLTVAHNDGSGNPAQAIDGDIDGNRTTYDLGVAIPVSKAGSVRAKYNFDRQDTTHSLVSGAVTKTHDLGLGYWHQLSKRTQLYVTANHEKREGQHSTSAMDFGMLHNF